ncbi:MAG: hypothetical protein HC836_15715 [Richelia sp. RM2_1_2]|nr:hypothetical protein [Richelia sp. RM2_1_2]
METLRVGSKGDSVRSLQLLLNQRGYTVDVDGVFGDESEDAIIDFQTKAKLNADGVVGEMTWNALLKNEVKTFVSKINKSTYLVNEKSFYPEAFAKKNIVLHHTAGWVVQKGTKDKASMNHVAWWNSRNNEISDTQGRVSTAFSIDYHGNIYQHFDPKFWAYHLGLGRAKNYLDKQSIGIEITNEGYMKRNTMVILYGLQVILKSNTIDHKMNQYT